MNRKKAVVTKRADVTEEQKLEIKEAFDLFCDHEGGGALYAITEKQLRVAVRSLGFQPDREELRQLIARSER